MQKAGPSLSSSTAPFVVAWFSFVVVTTAAIGTVLLGVRQRPAPSGYAACALTISERRRAVVVTPTANARIACDSMPRPASLSLAQR
jgi:hypothetical protein